MKRWIAAMLALLMLLSAGALAEDSAAVLTLDNVRVQSGDQTVELQGLAVSLVLENIGNLPAVALLIDGEGEPLATAVAQLTTEQLNIAVDGMDHGYYAPIPADQAARLAQVGDEGLAALVPALTSILDQVTMPMFSGADIPKLDVTGVLGSYITMTGNGVSEFEIPAEAIDELLDQLLKLAKARGDSASELDSAIELLEDFESKGQGVAIKGTITDDGATQKVDGDILLVAGRNDTQKVAELSIISAENSWRLAVSVRRGFLTLNVLTASLISRPAEERIDVGFSVFGGLDFSLTLFKEDGLQKATFKAVGLGKDAELDFAYGPQADGDLVSFGAKFDAVDLSANLKTVMGADGVRTGTLVCSLEQNGSAVALTADVTMYTGEGPDLSGVTIPADLRPIDQMDGEAVAKAFAPVSDFIDAHAVLK